jgi:hypothetical protein
MIKTSKSILATCITSITCILLLSSCSGSSSDPTFFEVKIENVSSSPSFRAQNGAQIITIFSSAIGMIHLQPEVLFTMNRPDYGQGLQDLAELGSTSRLLSSFRATSGVEVIGLADEPSMGSSGILAPGQSFTLLLSATSGDARLSLSTSFLQGNDILLMTPSEGIPLFTPEGNPISGDVTAQLNYYDLGTEVNEAPGIGPNQVIRQGPAPEGQVSSGAREGAPVRLLSDVNDGFDYPSVTQSIRVSLSVIQRGTNTSPSTESMSENMEPEAASPTPSPSSSPSTSPTPASSPANSSEPITSPSPELEETSNLETGNA